MAHYAFLDENNFVTQVIPGVEPGTDGIDWEIEYGNRMGQRCKRTSYANRIRGTFAGIGYYYDDILDQFIDPAPKGECIYTVPGKYSYIPYGGIRYFINATCISGGNNTIAWVSNFSAMILQEYTVVVGANNQSSYITEKYTTPEANVEETILYASSGNYYASPKSHSSGSGNNGYIMFANTLSKFSLYGIVDNNETVTYGPNNAGAVRIVWGLNRSYPNNAANITITNNDT
jgi:hypothetical protein